ncbi:MAG: hypothetical protein KF858_16065 [Candidatus Sumerlaeia bacterium]|nr:hypothetical protein [Candidatus Sumerlaeia bacterium]
MSGNQDKAFEALQRLEFLLSEDVDSEIDGLSQEEVSKRTRKNGFKTAEVMMRTQEALAVARDRETRANALQGIDRIRQRARFIMSSATNTADNARQRIQRLVQARPELAIVFRSFQDMQNPEEIEQALRLLDEIEANQEKGDA